MIRIKNAYFDYEGQTALEGINFKMEKDKVVLLGSNGSGKSTFLRIVAGLYFLKKGEYFLKVKKLRKKALIKNLEKV